MTATITKRLAVQAVLAGAKAAGLRRVIVIGVTHDGRHYAAASAETKEHLADIEKFNECINTDDWGAKVA